MPLKRRCISLKKLKRNKKRLQRKREKIQLLMKMENIFKLLQRRRRKPDSCRRCSSLVSKLLIRRLLWSRNNWQECQQLHHHQAQLMTVTKKLLKKLKLKWLLLRLLWTKDFRRRTIEFNKCSKKLRACQTSAHWLTCTDPFLIWAR